MPLLVQAVRILDNRRNMSTSGKRHLRSPGLRTTFLLGVLVGCAGKTSRTAWLAGLAALLVSGAFNTACAADKHACTLIYCQESARLTLGTPSGRLPAGNYDVQVIIDGVAADCTLAVSDAPPNFVQGACSVRILTLNLEAEVGCQSVSQGSSAGQSCTPVSGQFHLTAVVGATPAKVGVVVLRDGVEIGRDTIALQYSASEPNGPGCGLCHQASAGVSIAD
jgi:hypothetical protein